MLSYNVKLKTDEEGNKLLLHMLSQHKEAWDMISLDTFTNGKIDQKIIHDRNYYKCREEIDNIHSQIVIRAECSVNSTFRTIRTNGHLQRLEASPKNTNYSIRLDKRLYKFLPDNKIQINSSNGKIVCIFDPYPLLQNKLNTSTPHDPLIFVRNNEIFLSLSFDTTNPMWIEDKCIGVDLGIRRMAVTSEGNAYTDKNFLKERRRIRYLKRMLQRRKDIFGSNTAARKLKKLNRKEMNQTKNMLHHLSNAILETKATTIVLEDLTDIKKNSKSREEKAEKSRNKSFKARVKEQKFNNKNGQVPYYGLRMMLTWKAPLIGKKVVTVNPAYTSQLDCRGMKNGKRQGCRYYSRDGLVLDADGNAAVNIVKRYTDHHKLPLSFQLPLDGSMNFIGRLTSNSRIPGQHVNAVAGKPTT